MRSIEVSQALPRLAEHANRLRQYSSILPRVAQLHFEANGDVIYSRGYGMANLEYAVPNSPQTVFHVTSVSKQFTAMAVLLLERQGKLSLDDDVRKHLPELPDYGKPMTIEHLLYQTSGLPTDYLKLFGYAGIFTSDYRRFEDVYAMMRNLTSLNFPPGTGWQYSNTNYALLAEIVRRRTGKQFDAWLRDNLFQPLGMSHSVVPESRGLIVKNKAESYLINLPPCKS